MSEITLSKRLDAIASFVRPNSVLVDVGTDHGYLPVWLVLNNVISKAYACDVNEKPLEKAKNLIISTNLSEKIKTILTDGLNKIENLNVNEIVIAGMGYDLIIDIISRAKWLENNNIHLILQPMTGCEKVRSFLIQNGFEIKSEKAVLENGQIYSVLSVFYKNDLPQEKNNAFLYCGTHLNSVEHESILYVDNVLKKLNHIHSGLLKSKTIDHLEKSQKIKSIIESIEKERNR